MDNIRKIPTGKEMIEQLRRGKVSLPPLSIRLLEEKPKALDAYVEASWRKNTARFAIECKSISTPRAFQDGLNLLRSMSLPKGYRPIVPPIQFPPMGGDLPFVYFYLYYKRRLQRVFNSRHD